MQISHNFMIYYLEFLDFILIRSLDHNYKMRKFIFFCLVIDKQFKDAILSICADCDIDSWEIGKIVRKNDSTISKFLPEILT